MNKRRILAIAMSLVIVAIIAIGATVAYFTDTKNVTNTFTIGNVKIDLIESRFHREGNDNSGDMSIVTDGHKAFTDEEIQNDAKEYFDYIGEKGENMVPGRGVAKCPYVVNTGANDAYIRIRVMIPADLDTAILNSSMYTSSAINKNEFTKAFDQTGSV